MQGVSGCCEGQIWVTQPSALRPQCQLDICIKAFISCRTANSSKPNMG